MGTRKHIGLTALFCLLMAVPSLVLAQSKERPETVFSSCQVYVPNAFTPNGDNINDRFEIKYNGDCEVLEFSLQIYDRWGRLVFESNSPNPEYAWDGSSEGKRLNAGVYMWRLSARLVNSNAVEDIVIVNKQGALVLIR